MMTAAESTDLFKAKPIVKTDPIPDSLIVLELVRKHDTPDLIESANFFISTISVGYSSLFYCIVYIICPLKTVSVVFPTYQGFNFPSCATDTLITVSCACATAVGIIPGEGTGRPLAIVATFSVEKPGLRRMS